MDKTVYNKPWFVYIAECRDKTFYIGVARDANKRISDHNRTNKCKYTRSRKPLELAYKELCKNYSVARRREAELKQLSRKKKLELVKSELHWGPRRYLRRSDRVV